MLRIAAVCCMPLQLFVFFCYYNSATLLLLRILTKTTTTTTTKDNKRWAEINEKKSNICMYIYIGRWYATQKQQLAQFVGISDCCLLPYSILFYFVLSFPFDDCNAHTHTHSCQISAICVCFCLTRRFRSHYFDSVRSGEAGKTWNSCVVKININYTEANVMRNYRRNSNLWISW